MKYITTDSNSVTFDIYGKVLTFPKGGVYFKINDDTVTFFCAEQPFNNGYCIISAVADDLMVDGVKYTIDQIKNGAFEYFISVIDTRKYYTKTETHSYVNSRINELVDGAPEALDTLKELADLASNNEELIEMLSNSLSNVYTKEEVDEAIDNIDLSNFYTKSETYTKEEVDEAIDNIDLSNFYTKSETYTKEEVDDAIGNIDLSDFYTKAYIDEIESVAARSLVDLNNRIEEIPTVDLTDYYNKEEVDNLIDNIPSEWIGTQAEYDALGTYDNNTTYYIVEE